MPRFPKASLCPLTPSRDQILIEPFKFVVGPWTPSPQSVAPPSAHQRPAESPATAADSYVDVCPADFLRTYLTEEGGLCDRLDSNLCPGTSVLSIPANPTVVKDVQIPLGVVLRPLANAVCVLILELGLITRSQSKCAILDFQESRAAESARDI